MRLLLIALVAFLLIGCGHASPATYDSVWVRAIILNADTLIVQYRQGKRLEEWKGQVGRAGCQFMIIPDSLPDYFMNCPDTRTAPEDPSKRAQRPSDPPS